MARSKKQKGGWPWDPVDPNAPPAPTLSQRLSDLTPSFLKSSKATPPPSAALPSPVQEVVQDGQQMAQTAGRRIKKHFGYDPASSKSMRKLFRTAKGDRMLGGKRRNKTRKH
jgi:hypothetical protein